MACGLSVCIAAQLAGCAARQESRVPERVAFDIINAGKSPLCGLYLWRPEDTGNTGVLSTSPEMNNWLEKGTYLVAAEHPAALGPGQHRRFELDAPPELKVNVRIRGCEEQILYERENVELAEIGTLTVQ